MFDASIHKAVDAITPSWRGELEITDALQWLVSNKYEVRPHIHRGWWIDTGQPGDMLEANDLALEELDYQIEGYVDRDSQVGRQGHHRTRAQRSSIASIRGPSIIGENSRIVNSYIGPFTSIYHDVIVENSEIEHSMILEHSTIRDLGGERVQDSLVGRYVVIARSPIKPRAHKLTLGDHSKVGIL